jgi:ribonuclease VapC
VTARSCVLDASSVLALAHGEPGAEVVSEYLEHSAISTVNWSEIIRKSREVEVQIGPLRDSLAEADVALWPFVEADAEQAAALWGTTRHRGLSLADRACLALASRLGARAVTADRAWTDLDVGVDIVCIR